MPRMHLVIAISARFPRAIFAMILPCVSIAREWYSGHTFVSTITLCAFFSVFHEPPFVIHETRVPLCGMHSNGSSTTFVSAAAAARSYAAQQISVGT